MNYTVYQITNTVNGDIYVGAHQTDEMDDGYMGSGKYLHRAYKKYGMENFSKEILYIFETEEDMYAKEAEIVNEEFIRRPDTYNIRDGGTGGWAHINDTPKEERPNLIKIKEMKEQGLVNWGGTKDWSEAAWRKVSEQWWGSDSRKGNCHHLNYEQMTDEDKKERNRKISEAMSGDGNSQYGTAFYIDPVKEELPKNINGHRYKIGNQPTKWITFAEWRDARKDKSSSAYGKHWYTNGQKNFLLKENDAKIEINNLERGRIL